MYTYAVDLSILVLNYVGDFRNNIRCQFDDINMYMKYIINTFPYSISMNRLNDNRYFREHTLY